MQFTKEEVIQLTNDVKEIKDSLLGVSNQFGSKEGFIDRTERKIKYLEKHKELIDQNFVQKEEIASLIRLAELHKSGMFVVGMIVGVVGFVATAVGGVYYIIQLVK